MHNPALRLALRAPWRVIQLIVRAAPLTSKMLRATGHARMVTWRDATQCVSEATVQILSRARTAYTIYWPGLGSESNTCLVQIHHIHSQVSMLYSCFVAVIPDPRAARSLRFSPSENGRRTSSVNSCSTLYFTSYLYAPRVDVRRLSNLLSARSLLSLREHRRCCARRAMRAW